MSQQAVIKMFCMPFAFYNRFRVEIWAVHPSCWEYLNLICAEALRSFYNRGRSPSSLVSPIAQKVRRRIQSLLFGDCREQCDQIHLSQALALAVIK
jgi:hypothetical protein